MNLKSLQFYGVKFDIHKDTIFVNASDHVTFNKCDLKVNDERLVYITASKVLIKNTKLKLNSKGEDHDTKLKADQNYFYSKTS